MGIHVRRRGLCRHATPLTVAIGGSGGQTWTARRLPLSRPYQLLLECHESRLVRAFLPLLVWMRTAAAIMDAVYAYVLTSSGDSGLVARLFSSYVIYDWLYGKPYEICDERYESCDDHH